MNSFRVFACLLPLIAASFLGCAAPAQHVRACCQPAAMAMPMADDTATATTNSIFDHAATWQTDDGKDFQLADLRGHPVAISMIYASCEGVCVITRDDLQAVDASLPAATRAQTEFVLVTLDPEHDSPNDLKAYRAVNGLSAARWHLLRGSPADTAWLARALGIAYGRDTAGLFRHDSKLVVLDKSGNISERQDGIHADLSATTAALVAIGQQ